MLKLDHTTGEMLEISLFDLLDGGVKELADMNLQRVLDNIRDPNTEQKKARTITVRFTFTPNEMRDSTLVNIAVDSKIAPVKSVEATLDIGKDNGKLVAVERPKYTPGQLRMDGHETDTKIHALKTAQA
ncbi:replication terminator protein [Butyricicoccus sp.]|uniref:replication terminator protein n=1 Tax=Butyricicoccus sp. TaxID=2049021 RepID=UPI003F1368E3